MTSSGVDIIFSINGTHGTEKSVTPTPKITVSDAIV